MLTPITTESNGLLQRRAGLMTVQGAPAVAEQAMTDAHITLHEQCDFIAPRTRRQHSRHTAIRACAYACHQHCQKTLLFRAKGRCSHAARAVQRHEHRMTLTECRPDGGVP